MDLWQKKLAALLHDPPTKPLNIPAHVTVAESLLRNAGLDPVEARWFLSKVCDHTAAAADRVVCPKASVLHAEWSQHDAFRHPLGGGALRFAKALTASEAEEIVSSAQDRIPKCAQVAKDKQTWARFFLHWRLWPEYCAERIPHCRSFRRTLGSPTTASGPTAAS
jgi:CRISPR-associated protein Cmr2